MKKDQLKSINNIYREILLKKNSTVAKNFISLSILQATTYVFPLITIPYISRIFGPETFGLLNFAGSILGYFGLLVNYGFDLTASREIAQNRNNKVKIEEIFNRVLFSKLFLFLISTLVFIILLLTVSEINNYKTLYLIMFFGGIFNIFFPTWYFQGIEKLSITAIFTFIVRFIFTLIIFILIKEKSDYLFYPFATICGQAIVSVIAMYIITRHYGVRIYFPRITELLFTLKEGWRIFFTTVVINLYTTTNFVLLGFLAGTYEVGIYTAAFKIVAIFMSILSSPLSQAVYPNIGYSFSKSYELGINKIYKTLLIVIPITLVPSLLMFFFPGIIINILFGNKFSDAIHTLSIISFIPFIIGLSNIFGIQGLLNLKKDKYVTLITFVGAIIGISLNFILVPIYKHNGTAISWVITEIIITLLMFIAFVKSTSFLKDIKGLTSEILIKVTR